MPNTVIAPPLQFFADANGTPLDGGMIYIGQAGFDPRTNPVAVTWDEAASIPAAQPLRTIRGYVAYQGAPSPFYIAGDAYSLVATTSAGTVIYRNLNLPALVKINTDLATRAEAAEAAAEAAQAAAETARDEAVGAETGAVAAESGANAAVANATSYYPGARSFVPRGLTSVTITAAGTGGTNGTYTCPLVGDNLSVDASVTVVVSGGAVVSAVPAAPGLYIGSSPTPGLVDTSAIPGLTGATLTPVIGFLKTSGEYYLTNHATDTGRVSLFQNQSNVAVEVEASVDPFSVGAGQQFAADAANSVGAVLQRPQLVLQPDAGLVEGAWYGEFFVPTNTDYTLLRHWIYLGSGTCDLLVNVDDVNVAGPFAVTTTADSDVVAISATAGQRISFQVANITGTPGAISVSLEGLPA